MTSLDQQLSDAVADGRITEADVDEVLTFRAYLADLAELEQRAPFASREEVRAALDEVLARHYPDDPSLAR